MGRPAAGVASGLTVARSGTFGPLRAPTRFSPSWGKQSFAPDAKLNCGPSEDMRVSRLRECEALVAAPVGLVHEPVANLTDVFLDGGDGLVAQRETRSPPRPGRPQPGGRCRAGHGPLTRPRGAGTERHRGRSSLTRRLALGATSSVPAERVSLRRSGFRATSAPARRKLAIEARGFAARRRTTGDSQSATRLTMSSSFRSRRSAASAGVKRRRRSRPISGRGVGPGSPHRLRSRRT